jgi:POT family proton-dependent oligopeptide transporter
VAAHRLCRLRRPAAGVAPVLTPKLNHPRGLWLILFLELGERFSYYGMRSLLMLYMEHEMLLTVAQAGQIYGLFTGLAYLLPVLGGLLADRLLGERRAILWGAIAMAAGHFLMVVRSQWSFVVALSLLVLGTGLFKANSATLLGKLYDAGDARRDDAFRFFYLTVNVGAFAAPLVCSYLVRQGNWHLGFAAAGSGMLLGLLAWAPLEGRFGDIGGPPVPRHKEARAGARKPLGRIERDRLKALVVLSLIGNISLWAAIGQAGSSFTIFADRETRLVLPLLGWSIQPSSVQAANPLCILLGMPLIALLWRTLERRGHAVSPPVQIGVGLWLVMAGFVTMAVAGLGADQGHKVSLGWLMVATLLNTCGELCVSPLGLSMVTRLAPPQVAAGVMGMWYGSMALANGISGSLAGLYDSMPKGALFLMPALWTGAMGALLFALRRPLNRLLH